MKRQVRPSVLAIVPAVMLVACASKGPLSSSEAAALAGAEGATSPEYKSLIDNASKQIVCRRQAVTGSRIMRSQVCLTVAEIEARRERAAELIRDMQQQSAIVQPMPDRPAYMPPSSSPGQQ